MRVDPQPSPSIRLIDRLEDLRALAPAWEQLESQAVLPSQQFIYVEACASALAPCGTLQVLILETSGRLVAAAPLFRWRGQSYFEMLGVTPFFDPVMPLCAEPAAMTPVARALCALKVPLRLRRLPADSPLPDALQDAGRRQALVWNRPEEPWPSLALDTGWIEPETRFGSKRRAYLRRARRLAEEAGAVSSVLLAPSPADFPALLAEALRIEAAGWKGASGTALSSDPVVGGFYRRYAESACAKGLLRMAFLRIGSRNVAVQIGIELNGRLWLMKIGYDEGFQHCAPGNLLMRETISTAARQGLRSIELLGTMDSWKRQWTSQTTACRMLRVYPLNGQGALRLSADAARALWIKTCTFLRGSTRPRRPEGPLDPAER